MDLLFSCCVFLFFFFNDTATTEIYTLSLHDAPPIPSCPRCRGATGRTATCTAPSKRSEEHTSELQSHSEIVCRLLLEKKKKNTYRQRKEKEKYSDKGHKAAVKGG